MTEQARLDAQRILDAAARRILAERVEASASANGDPVGTASGGDRGVSDDDAD